ncbi:MAG: hypothetical protein ACPL7J_13120, partial [Desulfomonilaceae bacterium]
MRRGFQWKTQRTLFGLPLVCIAFGRDEKGKIRVARGVVAVGQVAIGAVACRHGFPGRLKPLNDPFP